MWGGVPEKRILGIVGRCGMILSILQSEDHRKFGAAEPGRSFDDGGQDRLQIEGRGANDLEHVGRSSSAIRTRHLTRRGASAMTRIIAVAGSGTKWLVVS